MEPVGTSLREALTRGVSICIHRYFTDDMVLNYFEQTYKKIYTHFTSHHSSTLKSLNLLKFTAKEGKYIIIRCHCSNVIMRVSNQRRLNGLLNICSGAGQRKHQSFVALAFVRGIHRLPVNSPHKGSVMRKMFPFDDVVIIIMVSLLMTWQGSRPSVAMILTISDLNIRAYASQWCHDISRDLLYLYIAVWMIKINYI